MRRFVAVVTVVIASVFAMAGVSGARQATAAVHAPRGVRHVRVVRSGSTAIVLSWRNPGSRSFAATTVVVRRGAHAARHVAGSGTITVSKHRHSVTVRDLAPSTRYSFALFASDGHRHYSRRVAISAPTTPASVTHVHTYTVRDGASVHWQNPTVRTFDHAVVRYARGTTPPATPSQGSRVALVRGLANAARITGLRVNTRYSVSVWAVDRAGRYSARQTAGFISAVPLATPGSYSGRVIDDAGHPLLNAEIDAVDYSDGFGEGTPLRTRSGLDGSFTLSLTPGEWFVSIDGQHISGGDSDPTGYLGVADDVTVRSAVSTNAGDVVLDPGGAVSGRVTDASGHPLGNAQVAVEPVRTYVQADQGDGVFFSFFFDYQSFPTAADGTYTIKGVPGTGALRICSSTGSTPITGGSSDAVGYTDRCAPRTVEAAPGTAVAASPIALDAELGGSASGRVTTADGAGAGNAIVTLIGGTDDSLGGSILAGADGSYRLDGLSAGTYRVCALELAAPRSSRTGDAPGCAADPITVFVGRASRADVALGVGAAVSGRITGAGGVPLANASVEIRGRNGDGVATTDADGHYRVKGLDTGEYTACVSDTSTARGRGLPTGGAPGCFGRRTHFGARAGSVRNGVDIRLGAAGAISGTVLDSAGAPVPFAEVDVEQVRFKGDGGFGSTDASGRYTVRGLAAGSYVVCFTSISDDLDSIINRCHRGRVTVTASRTLRGVDGVIPVRASISVLVNDQNGRPVAGVDAAALEPCRDSCDTPRLFGGHINAQVSASSITDSRGSADLEDLAPGSYAVCLFAFYATTADGGTPDGYADRCSGTTFDIVVRSGGSTPITLTLGDGGAVSGTVLDAQGRALRGVLVHVSGDAADDYSDGFLDGFFDDFEGLDGPATDSVTRADGTFTVRGVLPGMSRVCVDAADAIGPSPAGYLDGCVGSPVGSKAGAARVTIAADTDAAAGNLTLAAGAGISGRLVSAATRKPVRFGFVIVFAGRRENLVDEADTDSGSYLVGRLQPGDYTVCAIGYRAGGQCYRAVAWDYERKDPPLAKATLVTTTAGTVTDGIGFRLPAAR